MFQVPTSIHISILCGLEAVQAFAQKQFFGAWKIVFLQSPISSHKTIRGHATKKMNRKGELQTSRISSNLRIWQSYSRVPQILKVLCVWYTWKYVARLGFEPLKFLYSEFLYNTQAVSLVVIVYNVLLFVTGFVGVYHLLRRVIVAINDNIWSNYH